MRAEACVAFLVCRMRPSRMQQLPSFCFAFLLSSTNAIHAALRPQRRVQNAAAFGKGERRVFCAVRHSPPPRAAHLAAAVTLRAPLILTTLSQRQKNLGARRKTHVLLVK